MDPRRYIYIIYAIENEDFMLHLLSHLKPLEKDFNCTIWNDDPIYTGQLWKPKNASRIQQTDISLLLVSDAFMHSEFVKQLEFKVIIDRYQEGKAIVIPILLEPCPWDIDFKSDDYDFNLNEVTVLPEGRKPITAWDAEEKAYIGIASYVQQVISTITKKSIQAKPDPELELKEAKAKREEQLAISFSEEAESKIRVEEENKLKEAAEAKKRIEKENKIKEESEAKRKAEEKLRIEEENRLKKAEAKRKAEKEKSDRIAAEVKNRAEEEYKLRAAAEAKRKIEEQKSIEDEAVITKDNWDDHQAKPLTEANGNGEGAALQKNWNIKKRVLTGSGVVVLAIVLIWVFSVLNSGSEKEATPVPATKETVAKDDVNTSKTKMDAQNKPEALSKLSIGDLYEGGIIFTIDQAGKTGKIAHTDDAGPMTWNNAIKINELLGEGWRLPSFGELSIMYRNIGQGAENTGEFADGLYWSATAFDDYQARLLRFRDGNTSYHYNKELEHRKYLVRAIRDFSR